MKKTLYTCPACGFDTLSERGIYDICDICGREDDPVQLKNPSLSGGANKTSLFEAQSENMKKYPLGLSSFKGYNRIKKWIPSNAAMLKLASNQEPISGGLEYFMASGNIDNIFDMYNNFFR